MYNSLQCRTASDLALFPRKTFLSTRAKKKMPKKRKKTEKVALPALSMVYGVE